MSVKFSLSLFDADDLKMVEDMFARAMARAIVSALKIASREGLLLRPERVAEVVTPEAVFTEPEPVAPPPEPESEDPQSEPRVPIFLKPAPEHPFPPGKAVEPPPLKSYAKTRALYQRLYRTVAERPQGYVSVNEACDFLGGKQFSGPVSTWLQKGELEACIVANLKPPTKGLPGKLMIQKESLVARDKLRRSNRGLSVRERQTANSVAT